MTSNARSTRAAELRPRGEAAERARWNDIFSSITPEAGERAELAMAWLRAHGELADAHAKRACRVVCYLVALGRRDTSRTFQSYAPVVRDAMDCLDELAIARRQAQQIGGRVVVSYEVVESTREARPSAVTLAQRADGVVDLATYRANR